MQAKAKAKKIEIDGWRIAPRLLRALIHGRGPSSDCDGSCCRYGVYASTEERDLILKHAGKIQRHMDATQPRATSAWFSKNAHHDEDFADGVCFGTRVHRNKCVFRTQEGRCSLQLTEPEIDLRRGQRLKPFPCYLFPVTINGSTLDFDPLTEGKRPCCSLCKGGETRAVRSWATELKMVLGRTGYQKLIKRLGLSRRSR